MANALTAEMLAHYQLAYIAIVEDPADGGGRMQGVLARLRKLSPHQLDAEGGKLRNLLDRAARDLLGAFSATGEFQRALDWVHANGSSLLASNSEYTVETEAYFLHQLGQSRAAGELIVGILDAELEPSYISLPAHFHTLLQYRQFDLAHNWIAAKRDPAASTEAWLAPDGIALLYRLEAALLVEEGMAERALAAYAKAVRADEDGNVTASGLFEDLVCLGRANLALRLRKEPEKDDVHDMLWHAIALRARGRYDEANAYFVHLSDEAMPEDEYGRYYWVLAHAYLQIIAETDIVEQLEMAIEDGVEFEDVVYYAYAVALAANDQLEEAQSAMQNAMEEKRRIFACHFLDRELWYHIVQTQSTAAQESLRPYFDPTLMPERYL